MQWKKYFVRSNFSLVHYLNILWLSKTNLNLTSFNLLFFTLLDFVWQQPIGWHQHGQIEGGNRTTWSTYQFMYLVGVAHDCSCHMHFSLDDHLYPHLSQVTSSLSKVSHKANKVFAKFNFSITVTQQQSKIYKSLIIIIHWLNWIIIKTSANWLILSHSLQSRHTLTDQQPISFF